MVQQLTHFYLAKYLKNIFDCFLVAIFVLFDVTFSCVHLFLVNVVSRVEPVQVLAEFLQLFRDPFEADEGDDARREVDCRHHRSHVEVHRRKPCRRENLHINIEILFRQSYRVDGERVSHKSGEKHIKTQFQEFEFRKAN